MPEQRLIVSCPDRPGVVAATAGAIAAVGGNITSSHQFSSGGTRFFLRTCFDTPAAFDGERFDATFAADVAQRFAMTWRRTPTGVAKRVAVLVSREDHCLVELLWRWQASELHGEIVLVASNHDDLRAAVSRAGLPYHHVPVTPTTKPAAEAALLDLLAGAADVVVLARYMQILSEDFLARVGVPVINIHHSFLPAFVGSDPYRRAFERGVKLVGATAHYVTADLDAGPIIEQDVVRVTHADDVAELTRAGRDVERLVLARALRLHLDDRVAVDGGRTVVFT